MIFTIQIEPVPASRPRVTKSGTFYLKAYSDFRDIFDRWLMTQKREIIEGPVHVDATFYMKIPTSASKKKILELDETYCTKRVDIDNLEKALYDKINDFFIEDDSFIVSNSNKKIWSSNPRIEFEIKRL